jgi:DNA-binding MarR family transcriptional regulator
MLAKSLTYNLSSIVADGIGKSNHLFLSRVGWSVRELRVLRLVRETSGLTFTALAAATKFEKTLTSRILSKLIKAGLIVRHNSEKDARVFTLEVTEAGNEICAKADPLTMELEALILTPLDAHERDALLGMVEKIRAWVQTGYAAEVNARFPRTAKASAKAKLQCE